MILALHVLEVEKSCVWSSLPCVSFLMGAHGQLAFWQITLEKFGEQIGLEESEPDTAGLFLFACLFVFF